MNFLWLEKSEFPMKISPPQGNRVRVLVATRRLNRHPASVIEPQIQSKVRPKSHWKPSRKVRWDEKSENLSEWKKKSDEKSTGRVRGGMKIEILYSCSRYIQTERRQKRIGRVVRRASEKEKKKSNRQKIMFSVLSESIYPSRVRQ